MELNSITFLCHRQYKTSACIKHIVNPHSILRSNNPYTQFANKEGESWKHPASPSWECAPATRLQTKCLLGQHAALAQGVESVNQRLLAKLGHSEYLLPVTHLFEMLIRRWSQETQCFYPKTFKDLFTKRSNYHFLPSSQL